MRVIRLTNPAAQAPGGAGLRVFAWLTGGHALTEAALVELLEGQARQPLRLAAAVAVAAAVGRLLPAGACDGSLTELRADHERLLPAPLAMGGRVINYPPPSARARSQL